MGGSTALAVSAPVSVMPPFPCFAIEPTFKTQENGRRAAVPGLLHRGRYQCVEGDWEPLYRVSPANWA